MKNRLTAESKRPDSLFSTLSSIHPRGGRETDSQPWRGAIGKGGGLEKPAKETAVQLSSLPESLNWSILLNRNHSSANSDIGSKISRS